MENQQLFDLLEDKNGCEEPLEQQKNWDGVQMCLFQGSWCPLFILRPLLSFQKNFKPRDTDILIASLPKTGTTWLKALLFSIINRDRFPIDQSPLLTTNPHDLIRCMEYQYYANQENPDLENMNEPRLFQTHLPYQVLPSSITNSESKIVYISRNLLDMFISDREFFYNVHIYSQEFFLQYQGKPDFEPKTIEEAFEMFCLGIHIHGPFWEHILGYWKASLENPNKVLFLKYEDVKKDPISTVVKIAKFLGRPFSAEEEKRGLMREISQVCSFDKLKNLEVNKSGVCEALVHNSSFFRKGDIGDWKKYLSREMAERLKVVMYEKMSGFGLMIDAYFES